MEEQTIDKTNIRNHQSRNEICELKLINQQINDADNTCHNENKTPTKTDENVTWKDVRYQVWACNVGLLFTINDGMALSFSNLIFNEFNSHTSSWFASIIGLSLPIGSLVSGPLMDKFGRKTTNMIIVIPCVPAWFLTSFVDKDCLFLLYIARFSIGLAMGLATSNMVYASEISHRKYRSIFLLLTNFYFAFGILMVSVLQMFLTWRQVAFVNGLVFIVVFILNAFTPESPVWLAYFRSDWDKAKRALQWLNPNPKIFTEEWQELTCSIKAELTSSCKTGFKFKFMAAATYYKPLLILCILFLLQQVSFIYALIVYAIKIFPLISPKIGEVVKSEAFAILGIVRFVANCFCCLLSLKVGRRPLLCISSLGMTVTCLFIVILSYFQNEAQKQNLSDMYEWCLISLFLLFIIMGTFGVMTIPWCLTVELLPNELRSIGSGAMICYSYTLLFFFAKIFPYVLEVYSVNELFGFIGVVSTVISIFVYYFIPETLGKSFKDIERYFMR